MSINADISELAAMMDGITPLEIGDQPMTGKQFITAYQLEEAEKKTELKLVKYSRDELLKFRTSPLAMGRPVLKDPVVYSMSCWTKNSRAPEDEIMKRRSSADPRERMRREGDGIILSPQRGNFNNGCAVAPQPPHRRIGSGRLLKRDWDGDESLIFRPSRDERGNGIGDGKEMRSGRAGGEENRYNRQHRFHENRNPPAAPEWFTCGPTSQDETIDLHGFDHDVPERNYEKPKPKGKAEKQVIENEPVPLMKTQQVDESKQQRPPDVPQSTCKVPEESENFNFDDLMQNDALGPLLQDMGSTAASNSSRFSQFFSSNGEQVPIPVVAPPNMDPHLHSILNARQPNNDSGVVLMDLFRHEQQRQQQSGPSLKDLAATGKVTDVAEIEARYRQEQAVPADDINPEVQAFILKRAKQETAQRTDLNLLFTMQLQQQLAERNQAALLGKFMVPHHFQQLPHELQAIIANAKPTVEICTAPEFINVLSGFLQGRITIQSIVGQLMGTSDLRLQEMLISLLNLTLVNRDPFALHQMVMQNGIQQQQALRAHTSNIMQTALLRKKLEEQAENFKKRENLRTSEASRGTSPIPHGNSMSFTPTAVLRKMTADEKDGRRGMRGEQSPLPPEAPLSPLPSAMPQWGPTLRAITKQTEFDPATGRSQWVPAQPPAPNRFAFPPPAPATRNPPHFREPSPLLMNNVGGGEDEFRPMWNLDIRQRPQGRIINVEELERKTRMQRF